MLVLALGCQSSCVPIPSTSSLPRLPLPLPQAGCSGLSEESHRGVRGSWPGWVVSSPTRQCFQGSFPGKVCSSAPPPSWAWEFCPKIRPHLAILSLPFPKRRNWERLAWIYWNSLHHSPQTYLQSFLLGNSAEDQCEAVLMPQVPPATWVNLLHTFVVRTSAPQPVLSPQHRNTPRCLP